MGKFIEKVIKRELNGKPIVNQFKMDFEYRDYEDTDEKIITRFHHSFDGYLMLDNSVEQMRCRKAFIFDDKNRKLFCYQLHPDSKIDSINTPILIESILQNIVQIYKNMKKVYDEDIDNVPLFPITVMSPKAQMDALTNWRPAVARRYKLRLEQCHEVIFSETMPLEDMDKLQLPDFQIIRSQRGDISLFKKY